MSNKFHVSPDMFDKNIRNVYHPASTRKLGHIIKDKHGYCVVQTTEGSQALLFADDDNVFSAFSGMARNKRKQTRKPDPWELRMRKYHKNFDKYR